MEQARSQEHHHDLAAYYTVGLNNAIPSREFMGLDDEHIAGEGTYRVYGPRWGTHRRRGYHCRKEQEMPAEESPPSTTTSSDIDPTAPASVSGLISSPNSMPNCMDPRANTLQATTAMVDTHSKIKSRPWRDGEIHFLWGTFKSGPISRKALVPTRRDGPAKTHQAATAIGDSTAPTPGSEPTSCQSSVSSGSHLSAREASKASSTTPGLRIWNAPLREPVNPPATSEPIVIDGDEERRRDPMLDDRVVTFAEMAEGLADQELTMFQLKEHWNNLHVVPAKPKATVTVEAKPPPTAMADVVRTTESSVAPAGRFEKAVAMVQDVFTELVTGW